MRSINHGFYLIGLTLLLLSAQFSFAQQKKKVACIGDSVTKGYLIKGKSYPEQLQELLGDNYIVKNFGHSGSTLLSKGHRPYTNTEEYQKALGFNADIIVVALGLNDTDPRNWPNFQNEFIADYSSLLQSFKNKNPNLEVYVCLMTPIFSGHPRFLSGTRDWFDAIQTLIPEIAKANKAAVIDNHSPLQARIDLFDDYLHPNEQGAGIIARTVFKALKPIHQALIIDYTFGSNMVLQRETDNILFGKGTANEMVTVRFKDNTYKTRVNKDGNWLCEIPPMKAGGPYRIVINSLPDEIILENVLFGDVYLASGQSNMAFMLKQAANHQELLQKAVKNSQVRLFKNRNFVETTNVAWDTNTLARVNNLQYFEGKWELPNMQNTADFSAIAIAFAESIAESEQIPIGIIEMAVGGSNTESWIPRKTLENDNLLASYISNWRTSDFIQDFCRERANQNLAHSTVKNQRHPYGPAYNFEAGITKWTNTHLKGILWYQGESNAHNVELHDHLFKTLVTSWRASFDQELPFYFVQLSSINRPSWPTFRDHQRLLNTQIPKVYMAISSDLGDPTDVHPKEKIIIGQRLAKLVSKHEYGGSVNADSPQPKNVYIKERTLTIVFSNAKQLKTKDNRALKGFTLVTETGQTLPVSDATIHKNTVRIPLPQENIRQVQYAYEGYTKANLQNEATTPASTFTTTIK